MWERFQNETLIETMSATPSDSAMRKIFFSALFCLLAGSAMAQATAWPHGARVAERHRLDCLDTLGNPSEVRACKRLLATDCFLRVCNRRPGWISAV